MHEMPRETPSQTSIKPDVEGEGGTCANCRHEAYGSGTMLHADGGALCIRPSRNGEADCNATTMPFKPAEGGCTFFELREEEPHRSVWSRGLHSRLFDAIHEGDLSDEGEAAAHAALDAAIDVAERMEKRLKGLQPAPEPPGEMAMKAEEYRVAWQTGWDAAKEHHGWAPKLTREEVERVILAALANGEAAEGIAARPRVVDDVARIRALLAEEGGDDGEADD